MKMIIKVNILILLILFSNISTNLRNIKNNKPDEANNNNNNQVNDKKTSNNKNEENNSKQESKSYTFKMLDLKLGNRVKTTKATYTLQNTKASFEENKIKFSQTPIIEPVKAPAKKSQSFFGKLASGFKKVVNKLNPFTDDKEKNNNKNTNKKPEVKPTIITYDLENFSTLNLSVFVSYADFLSNVDLFKTDYPEYNQEVNKALNSILDNKTSSSCIKENLYVAKRNPIKYDSDLMSAVIVCFSNSNIEFIKDFQSKFEKVVMESKNTFALSHKKHRFRLSYFMEGLNLKEMHDLFANFNIENGIVLESDKHNEIQYENGFTNRFSQFLSCYPRIFSIEENRYVPEDIKIPDVDNCFEMTTIWFGVSKRSVYCVKDCGEGKISCDLLRKYTESSMISSCLTTQGKDFGHMTEIWRQEEEDKKLDPLLASNNKNNNDSNPNANANVNASNGNDGKDKSIITPTVNSGSKLSENNNNNVLNSDPTGKKTINPTSNDNNSPTTTNSIASPTSNLPNKETLKSEVNSKGISNIEEPKDKKKSDEPNINNNNNNNNNNTSSLSNPNSALSSSNNNNNNSDPSNSNNNNVTNATNENTTKPKTIENNNNNNPTKNHDMNGYDKSKGELNDENWLMSNNNNNQENLNKNKKKSEYEAVPNPSDKNLNQKPKELNTNANPNTSNTSSNRSISENELEATPIKKEKKPKVDDWFTRRLKEYYASPNTYLSDKIKNKNLLDLVAFLDVDFGIVSPVLADLKNKLDEAGYLELQKELEGLLGNRSIDDLLGIKRSSSNKETSLSELAFSSYEEYLKSYEKRFQNGITGKNNATETKNALNYKQIQDRLKREKKLNALKKEQSMNEVKQEKKESTTINETSETTKTQLEEERKKIEQKKQEEEKIKKEEQEAKEKELKEKKEIEEKKASEEKQKIEENMKNKISASNFSSDIQGLKIETSQSVKSEIDSKKEEVKKQSEAKKEQKKVEMEKITKELEQQVESKQITEEEKTKKLEEMKKEQSKIEEKEKQEETKTKNTKVEESLTQEQKELVQSKMNTIAEKIGHNKQQGIDEINKLDISEEEKTKKIAEFSEAFEKEAKTTLEKTQEEIFNQITATTSTENTNSSTTGSNDINSPNTNEANAKGKNTDPNNVNGNANPNANAKDKKPSEADKLDDLNKKAKKNGESGPDKFGILGFKHDFSTIEKYLPKGEFDIKKTESTTIKEEPKVDGKNEKIQNDPNINNAKMRNIFRQLISTQLSDSAITSAAENFLNQNKKKNKKKKLRKILNK